MSGHTPGPWVQNGTHGHRFIGPAGNEEGCVAIACKVDGRDGWKEMMANASLIAAAPDLLAALIDCLPCLGWKNDSLEELQREHELGNGYAQSIINARAAIARATGEQK